ncbi:PilZ domain-containing protein [Halomonas sp. DP8Y7-1]|uniref:HD domain-containing phosphohydrolase n=1 Tax=Halomonas sp. DP8Y7-1 TaxID=2859078 RepID=UPI001C9510BF|nr:HD domain-containing phosphohydrolase [Halomonas sp. DP8Y7-1]MBY6031062.1 PilZ domain-containing protein [Halomonas sp. DP8Y7-1]
MADQQEFETIRHPQEVAQLLDCLSGPQGAGLVWENSAGTPAPVVLVELLPGESITLDITAAGDLGRRLKQGQPFRLMGYCEGMITRTSVLEASQGEVVTALSATAQAAEAARPRGSGVPPRQLWRCPYPETLERLQRRRSFRARLRLGMAAEAILHDSDGQRFSGDLIDLSIDGCRLDLPHTAAALLGNGGAAVPLELGFPDGSRLTLKACVQHHRFDPERRLVEAGFHFTAVRAHQERTLWQLVREIERESARIAEGVDSRRPPSALFQPSQGRRGPRLGRREAETYPTDMTRRLSRIAGYLHAQALELAQGGCIHGPRLSRQTDQLLALYDEDRNGLIFALRFLTRESWPVRHGLSVAILLVDLLADSLPAELRKSITASAMIHDLGKVLLPAPLRLTPTFGDAERSRLIQHVGWLKERLSHCAWINASVFEAVACQINERLDGSGYPLGIQDADLRELARASAVVDAIDAMRAQRPDRPPWRIAAIYRYLLDHPEKFDSVWVKRFIQRFGLYPIGALVRFSDNSLGWILALDDQSRPACVQRTTGKPPSQVPRAPLDGARVEGEALAALGAIQGEVIIGA